MLGYFNIVLMLVFSLSHWEWQWKLMLDSMLIAAWLSVFTWQTGPVQVSLAQKGIKGG